MTGKTKATEYVWCWLQDGTTPVSTAILGLTIGTVLLSTIHSSIYFWMTEAEAKTDLATALDAVAADYSGTSTTYHEEADGFRLP